MVCQVYRVIVHRGQASLQQGPGLLRDSAAVWTVGELHRNGISTVGARLPANQTPVYVG